MTKELTLPSGKTYRFAPMPFTEENADLICELTVSEGETVNVRKVLPALARVTRQSLEVANHTPEEIAAALSEIGCKIDGDSVLMQIIPVLIG